MFSALDEREPFCKFSLTDESLHERSHVEFLKYLERPQRERTIMPDPAGQEDSIVTIALIDEQ